MKLRLVARWERSRAGELRYVIGDYSAGSIRAQNRKGLPWASQVPTEIRSCQSHPHIYTAIRTVQFSVEKFFGKISPDIEIVHPPEEETAALFTEVQQP